MEEAVLDLHHDVSEVRSRLLQTAMKHLIAEGKTELEAREIAERVLSKPSPFMLPTFEELDG